MVREHSAGNFKNPSGVFRSIENNGVSYKNRMPSVPQDLAND